MLFVPERLRNIRFVRARPTGDVPQTDGHSDVQSVVIKRSADSRESALARLVLVPRYEAYPVTGTGRECSTASGKGLYFAELPSNQASIEAQSELYGTWFTVELSDPVGEATPMSSATLE